MHVATAEPARPLVCAPPAVTICVRKSLRAKSKPRSIAEPKHRIFGWCLARANCAQAAVHAHLEHVCAALRAICLSRSCGMRHASASVPVAVPCRQGTRARDTRPCYRGSQNFV
eukprot:scaffold10196_cov129-Isochrysis_galbana.AAC.4